MWLVFAALSAASFGLRGILYQWTSRKPIDRNLLLLGVYLCGTIVALVVNAFARQPWTYGSMVGLMMGLFSFSSNAAMYRGFAVGKASLIAILTALPPVVVVGLAYALWGEKLTFWQTVSFAVIIAGILMIRYSNDISLANLQGAHWGFIAMITFGLTDLFSKQSTLMGGQTFPTLVVMYATGSALFAVSWAAAGLRRRRTSAQPAHILAAATEEAAASEVAAAAPGGASTKVPPHGGPAGLQAPVSWSARRTLLWGMAVGLSNISGMMLALPAFRLGITGLVSAVLAMNVLLVLLYARLVLKERFRSMEIAGIVCTIAGMLILRLAG